MMPRRPRPTTPSTMLGPLGVPNSPPQTPTSTSSPMLNRKKYAASHLPPYSNMHRPVLPEDPAIQPTGNGHQFSFTPSNRNRFAQLSPLTSSEDSEDEHDESESEIESEQSDVAPALPMSRDDAGASEEDDSEEDSEEDSDEDENDDDEDVLMDIHPPAPVPLPATRLAPTPDRMQAHGMSMDSASDEYSDDEEEREGDDEEEEDDSEDESDSDSDSDSGIVHPPPPVPEIPRAGRTIAATSVTTTTTTTTTTTATVKANFILEELSDFDPMDPDRVDVMAPTGFSSPASARSRSRAPTELPHLTRDMENLNWGASDSDNDLDADAVAHREFVKKQREIRMLNRRAHGSSIGKRTISERSDSDHEDWTPLDPDAVGSSARRLRRRVGDRRSFIHLQFPDPPPPRIDELDEPDSEVEGLFYCDHETLARELPYWSIEIMEYESPSP